MEDLIKQITELTGEWYWLIGKDHHKDRDCHWHIYTTWSYGYPPIYHVEHNGYLHTAFSIECVTYLEALETLKNSLIEAIANEKENQARYEE